VRITYVGTVPPHRGGVAQHGGRLVDALRAAGHDVVVLSWRSVYPKWWFKGHQPTLSRDDQPDQWFGLRWWSPFSWLAARRRTRGADLVVVPWVTPAQAPALLTVLGARSPARKVLIVHNPEPHERTASRFACSMLVLTMRRCDAALVHSRAAAATLRSLAARPVEVVDHPPNVDVYPQPLTPRPPLRLLFLGFVRPYKGLDDAFGAVRVLRDRGVDVRLTVAGEFWDPVENWRSRAQELGIEELVDLRSGYVPDADLEALLGEHHIVVAPYRQASQSGVVPLSFAAARPVVATNVGGLPEMVIERRTGAIVGRRDPVAFADGVERVAANLDWLSTQALSSVGSWDVVAAAVVALGSADKVED